MSACEGKLFMGEYTYLQVLPGAHHLVQVGVRQVATKVQYFHQLNVLKVQLNETVLKHTEKTETELPFFAFAKLSPPNTSSHLMEREGYFEFGRP